MLAKSFSCNFFFTQGIIVYKQEEKKNKPLTQWSQTSRYILRHWTTIKKNIKNHDTKATLFYDVFVVMAADIMFVVTKTVLTVLETPETHEQFLYLGYVTLFE